MMEMFEELAPVLEDGSDLFINCDDGVDVLVIKDGKCIQEKWGDEMKDILLEKVFEAERWEAAINKGFFKGIDKGECSI